MIRAEDLIIPQGKEGGRKTLKMFERDVVLKTLEEMGGNKTRTAEALDVSLRWLHYRLNEWKKEES